MGLIYNTTRIKKMGKLASILNGNSLRNDDIYNPNVVTWYPKFTVWLYDLINSLYFLFDKLWREKGSLL